MSLHVYSNPATYLWEICGTPIWRLPMARTVRNQKLDTRSARAMLPMKTSGYRTSVAKGCAIGYRKGPKGGAWLAKIVREDYRRETTLGAADDILDADGLATLDFGQAQAAARVWF